MLHSFHCTHSLCLFSFFSYITVPHPKKHVTLIIEQGHIYNIKAIFFSKQKLDDYSICGTNTTIQNEYFSSGLDYSCPFLVCTQSSTSTSRICPLSLSHSLHHLSITALNATKTVLLLLFLLLFEYKYK